MQPSFQAVGKGESPKADADGARQGLWASVNIDHLCKLIMDQIPRCVLVCLRSPLSRAGTIYDMMLMPSVPLLTLHFMLVRLVCARRFRERPYLKDTAAFRAALKDASKSRRAASASASLTREYDTVDAYLCNPQKIRNASGSTASSPSNNSRTVTKFFSDFDIFRPSICKCPVCNQHEHHVPVKSALQPRHWAISFSWWGKARSTPPALWFVIYLCGQGDLSSRRRRLGSAASTPSTRSPLRSSFQR